MIKRVTWFVGGAVVGMATAGAAKRKLDHTVHRTATVLAPSNVARATVDRVRDAVAEGKRAARAKEAELRAVVHGAPTTLAEHLDEGDRVYVDGRPVEPGQVIVLRQVRDERARRRRA
jgi:hypothetical protein